MLNFRGRHPRSLDPKGRIILPPEYREALLSRSPDGSLALTTYDGCIVGFPMPDWLQYEEQLNNINVPSQRVRAFRRLVIGGMTDVTPDSQGRIRLSSEQLEYAGIDQEAKLTGIGRRFEIWAPERLRPVIDDHYEDVADALAASGVTLIF
jgi:MraZ protein